MNTDNGEFAESVPTSNEEEVVVETNFSSLFSSSDIDEAPTKASNLEKTLATVDKSKEMAVKNPSEAHFRFRELLTDNQRKEVATHAPAMAANFVKDVNEIVRFGGDTIERMKQTSIQMLEAQKSVKIPEADVLMGDLLRSLDGITKKKRNKQTDNLVEKFMSFIKGVKNSSEAAIRDMKPIEEKLDMVELKLEAMDSQLEENVARGQILHGEILKQMNEVVAVLAALEEIIENIRAEYEEADAILVAANKSGEQYVTYKGETISVNELHETHAQISLALSESEKTWHDWRQQFFLGWANAPTTRNLVVSIFSYRRRLNTFKTMGIQSGRQALVNWKQAIEARSAAEAGTAAAEFTNKALQAAYGEMAETTRIVADASQAPLVTEETVHTIIKSIKDQANFIVQSDREGRALRAKNVQALERGEVEIKDEVLAIQGKLANNARQDRALASNSKSNVALEAINKSMAKD